MEQILVGQSEQKVFKDKRFIYKEIKVNELNIFDLLKINYKYFPKFYGIENNYYKFKFIKGISLKRPKTMNYNSIKSLIDKVWLLHKKSFSFFNKILCHGDLSPTNVVFNKKMNVKKIIDWDSLYFGNEYDDMCYIIWLWCNFGSYNDSDIDKINLISKTIKYFFKKYQTKDIDKLNFEMIKMLKAKQKNKKSNKFMNYDEIAKWHNYCIEWWNKNYKIIREEITKNEF